MISYEALLSLLAIINIAIMAIVLVLRALAEFFLGRKAAHWIAERGIIAGLIEMIGFMVVGAIIGTIVALAFAIPLALILICFTVLFYTGSTVWSGLTWPWRYRMRRLYREYLGEAETQQAVNGRLRAFAIRINSEVKKLAVREKRWGKYDPNHLREEIKVKEHQFQLALKTAKFSGFLVLGDWHDYMPGKSLPKAKPSPNLWLVSESMRRRNSA